MIESSDLAAVTGLREIQPGTGSFTKASIDSRSLTGGELFFAIQGARDGHEFIAAAVEAGATGVVIDRDVPGLPAIPPAVGVYRVPDSLVALQQVGLAVRQRSAATVTAVTGSAGKTTTKTFIAAALASHYSVLANRASYNNHLGVPLTLSELTPGHTHAVVEVGTNNPGEIAFLAGIVRPEIAVITNIGYAHLGQFPDQAALAAEKTALLSSTTGRTIWVLNGDDALLAETAAGLPRAAEAQIVTVGFGAGNVISASDVAVSETGTSGVLRIGTDHVPFHLAVSGRHFVYGAMFAVAIAQLNGIEPRDALKAIEATELPAGRAQLRRIGPHLITIDDSYNGSPDSMLSSLDLLGSLPAANRIAVLGEMRELGTFGPELHNRVGVAAAAHATHLVTVGPDGELIGAGARAAGLDPANIHSTPSAYEAQFVVQQIVDQAAGTDTVLLTKGSRFVHMERVIISLTGRPVRCDLASCDLYINCSTCVHLEAGW